ncbi:MAG: hypothetical protein KF901_16935 [Myxococcales bacterium]|nr:hypothetical protein [Myxococcales bacterium]
MDSPNTGSPNTGSPNTGSPSTGRRRIARGGSANPTSTGSSTRPTRASTSACGSASWWAARRSSA